MKQLTIRGFDTELEKRIREVAEKEGTSLNKAALKFLRRGAGLSKRNESSVRIGSFLDHLAGTWSEEEARVLEEVTRDFERIDPGQNLHKSS